MKMPLGNSITKIEQQMEHTNITEKERNAPRLASSSVSQSDEFLNFGESSDDVAAPVYLNDSDMEDVWTASPKRHREEISSSDELTLERRAFKRQRSHDDISSSYEDSSHTSSDDDHARRNSNSATTPRPARKNIDSTCQGYVFNNPERSGTCCNYRKPKERKDKKTWLCQSCDELFWTRGHSASIPMSLALITGQPNTKPPKNHRSMKGEICKTLKYEHADGKEYNVTFFKTERIAQNVRKSTDYQYKPLGPSYETVEMYFNSTLKKMVIGKRNSNVHSKSHILCSEEGCRAYGNKTCTLKLCQPCCKDKGTWKTCKCIGHRNSMSKVQSSSRSRSPLSAPMLPRNKPIVKKEEIDDNLSIGSASSDVSLSVDDRLSMSAMSATLQMDSSLIDLDFGTKDDDSASYCPVVLGIVVNQYEKSFWA